MCQHWPDQEENGALQSMLLVSDSCDREHQAVKTTAARTARERDHIQDDQTACPAQVGQQINEAAQLSWVCKESPRLVLDETR